MTIGTVKFFNTTKGFGFIAPEGGGKDVFVHATAVEAAGMRSLSEGQKVSFDIVPDARGAKAANLKAVESVPKFRKRQGGWIPPPAFVFLGLFALLLRRRFAARE